MYFTNTLILARALARNVQSIVTLLRTQVTNSTGSPKYLILRTDPTAPTAPLGAFTILGNLDLLRSATTIFNVTPQTLPTIAQVDVYNVHGIGGLATLDGRVSVTMTGSNFTPGMSFTLLHADTIINSFSSESITYGINSQCIRPEIQYDYVQNNVSLYIGSCN